MKSIIPAMLGALVLSGVFMFVTRAGEAQQRLARDAAQVRVLIAYGEYWFPWYMRRLAERPANVWFVAKSLFG